MFASNILKFGVLILLFFAALGCNLVYGGSESIGLSNFNSNDFIFWQIRLPKTITAIFAGACLSVSGLILQVIFRNPLAGPYVLGISTGASLMVAISVLAGNSVMLVSDVFFGKSLTVFSAILGSFLITFLILGISKKVSSNVVLLLIGLMFSQICGALESALEYFADPNNLKSFVIWGMGSVGTTTLKDLGLFVPSALLSLVALVGFIKPLNALLIGENYTQNLGMNYTRNRFYLILISSVLTGLVTAFCGPIAFVGIAVPILSRMIFKSSRQELQLLGCFILGSTLLLISDTLCYNSLPHIALPINMITTFIGAPLVIYLMFKNKHW